MNLEMLKTYLSDKPGAKEDMPFGPDALVYKVRGKMFALVAWNSTPLRVSLKCRPAHAVALRAEYPAIQPGYHLNKKHWNTVALDQTVPEATVLSLIDESYRLVVQNLPKAVRAELEIDSSSTR